jgi:hypothetical protein
MMKIITKKTPLIAVTMTILSSSGLAHAADSNSDTTTAPTAGNHGVIVAIQQLGNQIEALTKSGVKSVNELAYKLDDSFPLTMELNLKQDDVQKTTQTQTQLVTDRSVKRNLAPFSANTLTYTNQSQPEVQKVNAETKARTAYINQLKDLEASDSLYSLVQGIDVSTYWTKKNLGSPGRNDSAFDFGAFIEPEAYTTPEQVKNSDNFIGYATKQYQSYADDLDLGTLKSALMQYQKQGVKTLAQQINQFSNNSAYKNYQLTIRSMTATTSTATDILSGMAAERTPILKTDADPQLDSISRAIGVEPGITTVKNANGDDVTMYRYASPLQIAKYRANYRLNSTPWYQEVASDSAENLQRKSVILLAEISSQLYQNHLDNEKIMGALAMLNLQSSDNSALMLKTQVKSVNDAIASFAGNASASNQSQSSSSSSSSTTSSTSTSGTTDPNSIDTSSYSNVDPNNPSTYNTSTSTTGTN